MDSPDKLAHLERIGIRQWLLLGPFDDPDCGAENWLFPPEEAIELNASYDGKSGSIVWRSWSVGAGLMDTQSEPLQDIGFSTHFHGKNPVDKNQTLEFGDPATNWRRSNPDITVYIPREGELNDGDNEHFLVFESPKSNDLLAMWTQGTVEAHGDNHIVLARSRDGVDWSEPKIVVGTRPSLPDWIAGYNE